MSARSAAGPSACVVCGAHLVDEPRADTCGSACSRLVADFDIFVTEARLPLAPRMRLLLAGLLEGAGADLRLTARGHELARSVGLDTRMSCEKGTNRE